MKKIKFIPLVLIAIALITTSCAIDNDDPILPRDLITKTVSFADSQIIVSVSETPYDLSVFVDQAFATNALVEYTMNGAEDGSTISFGNTMGRIPVDISQDGAVITVTLTSVSVLNKPETVDAVIDENNKTVQIIVLDLPAPNPNSVELVFLNTDEQAAIWFGLSQFTTDGTWITDYNQNSNGTYPRMMSIPLDGNGNLGAIPNSSDVAPNVIALDLYTQTTISDPMGYSIVVVFPNGDVELYSGEISSGVGVDNAVVLVDITDDAANPGMKSYEFSNF